MAYCTFANYGSRRPSATTRTNKRIHVSVTCQYCEYEFKYSSCAESFYNVALINVSGLNYVQSSEIADRFKRMSLNIDRAIRERALSLSNESTPAVQFAFARRNAPECSFICPRNTDQCRSFEHINRRKFVLVHLFRAYVCTRVRTRVR